MNDYVNKLLSKEVQVKIHDTLTAFETGTLKGNYGNVDIYPDGAGNSRQITYGKACTTEQGNLKALIQMYVNSSGQYAPEFAPYLSKIGRVPLAGETPEQDDHHFIGLLKLAGSDPIMISSQDLFFDEHYYFPASTFFETNKFTLALSLLVIYDSYIHSGSIRQKLRNQFAERPPVFGGDEKQWILQYVRVRHAWLKQGGDIVNGKPSRPILKDTIYRTKCLMENIITGNWDLSKPYYANDVLIK